jgi:hypothetical protein
MRVSSLANKEATFDTIPVMKQKFKILTLEATDI